MPKITLQDLYTKFRETAGVSTDTRQDQQNKLFFALKGPNFDANKFAVQALEKGAKYVVIDEPEYDKDDRYLLVEDGLNALQELANFHRKQLDIPVLGITGSNGKTTTKELLHTVLSKKYKTSATVGNLNNHIGVPLTLLAIDDSIEIAIVEMGANKVGDIQELCDIAEPSHGLITNIGKAHIEGFGGYEGIVRGKSELYHFLIQNDGVIFVNSRQEPLRNMAKRMKNPFFYPEKGDYLHCEFISASPFVKYRSENGKEVATHLLGKYNFDNIATALCVGKYFEVEEDTANEAIATYIPANMRSQLIEQGSNTIILDAYNANPTSMEAAIDNLKHMNHPRKVAILGDMNELGTDTEMEHRKLGELLKESGVDEVFLCGEKIKPALETYPMAVYTQNREALSEILRKKHFENSLILIKASRSVGLEGIVDIF